MIKVDGLAAGVLLRKVGLVLLILAWSWHSICKSSQAMRKKDWRMTKSHEPCKPTRSKEKTKGQLYTCK